MLAEPVPLAAAVDDELHHRGAVVLDPRAPSAFGVVGEKMADAGVSGGVGDEPTVPPAVRPDRRVAEPRVHGAIVRRRTVAERAHEQGGIDGGPEVRGGVDPMEIGAHERQPAPPRVREHLPADGGLAEHRQHGVAATTHLVAQARHDPLRHVEIALAGARVEPDVAADVRLRRQVGAAERADRGVGHPRRVAEDEQRVREAAEPRRPVDREDVGLAERGAGRAAAGGAQMLDAAVDADDDVDAGKRRAGRGEEGAGAARRLEHGARRDAPRRQEPAHGARQRGRRLEVAELVAAHRAARAGSRSDGRRAPVARKTRPPITLLATITRNHSPPYATALGWSTPILPRK